MSIIRTAHILDAITLLAGVSSELAGSVTPVLLAVALHLNMTEGDGRPPPSFLEVVHDVSHPERWREPGDFLTRMFGPSLLAAVLGGLGIGLARRGGRQVPRGSVAGMAARFSWLGLGLGAGLIALAVLAFLVALGLRAYYWG